MRIILTRTSHTHHTLEIVRDDGSRETTALETKTFLIHDLVHYAIESIASTMDGVWGTVEKGGRLDNLAETNTMTNSPELAAIESIAGAFHNVTRGATSQDITSGIRNLFAARHIDVPAWLTPAFADAVRERLRQLIRHWNSLEIGQSMELPWPVKQ